MVMKRIVFMLSLSALLGACNKPSEESCKAAIENMQKLLGTETIHTDIKSEVRRCTGGSSKDAVECAIKATSVEQLHACDFMKPKK
jgi:hypothetical protein